MISLPKSFIDQIHRLYPEDAMLLIDSICYSEAPISIRLNPKKKSNTVKTYYPIPWNENGFYLDSRPSFTLDPLFQAGTYYVQEASSQILGFVIKTLGLEGHTELALDLCAAPGGKTTLLSDILPNAVILSNEVIRSRAMILKENIIKWGTSNVVITSNDVSQFKKTQLTFDLILTDVPCSGEGMFRKDPQSVQEWSPESVEYCTNRQQRILSDIIPMLSEGGYLIYSTCTYNYKENIEQVIWMTKNYGLSSVKIDLPSEWGIMQIQNEESFAYQCMPHRVKGEGFFFAVLKNKNHTPIPKPIKTNLKLRPLTKDESKIVKPFVKEDILEATLIHSSGTVYFLQDKMRPYLSDVISNLHLIYSGTLLGIINGEVFIPDHALLMANLENSNIIKTNLSHNEAIDYCRRNLQVIRTEGRGWQIACFKGFNLGWFKQLGNRINNYFPTELRVRM